MIDENRRAEILLPAGALPAVLALWWLLTTLGDIPPFILPGPGAVGSRIVSSPELYIVHGRHTLERILFGGGVGILAGATVGVFLYFVSPLRPVLMPYVVTIRVLPKIAVAPVLLIFFGTGSETAVLLIALIVFFPMVLTTAAGFERAPDRHRDLLASVDAGTVEVLLYLYLPFALPDVFAGLKQSITLAVVGAIVAEWIIVDDGLGHIILIGSENLQTDLMIAALFVLLLLGIALYTGIAAIQRVVYWAEPETLLE